MASSRFRRKTVDTLARRAAFLCSNPDCRKSTVGPNSDPEKATTIGEAAHIFGARDGASRFREEMTSRARSSITNGIWLCRNCHRRVDADESRFTSEVLFAWREQHEDFVLAELGSTTDRLLGGKRKEALREFTCYPPLIRRIVSDQPTGWEWMLTAELMRHLNGPALRRLSDLRKGMQAAPQTHVSEEEAPGWVRNQVTEMSRLLKPLGALIQQLELSWGKPGESGSVGEIHRTCLLFQKSLEQVVQFEERVYFTNGPAEYGEVLRLLRDVSGSQAEKVAEIPVFMDELVSALEPEEAIARDRPRVLTKTITLDVPDDWEKKFLREFKRAQKGGLGCLAAILVCSLSGFVVALL